MDDKDDLDDLDDFASGGAGLGSGLGSGLDGFGLPVGNNNFNKNKSKRS